MRWPAPPDRRELALVIFSLSIFTISYNLESSIQVLGLDPVRTQSVVNNFAFGRRNVIGSDGRKLKPWRDLLEDQMYGDWAWESGHIAGNQKQQELGVDDIFDVMWQEQEHLDVLPEESVNHAFRHWGEDVPTTTVLQHVPGYTALDNVILWNGGIYVVLEDPSTFPDLQSVVADNQNWQVLSPEAARTQFGKYGGTLSGVTWLSTDPLPHNSTLFALWRTHSSISTSNTHPLPPPTRLILPSQRVYTDPDPEELSPEYWLPRPRADIGFHPYLAKAAFPHLTTMYLDDWKDYSLSIPFLIERMVVADREAAAKTIPSYSPVYYPLEELTLPEGWWNPVQERLTAYLGLIPQKRKMVTFLHGQRGPSLRPEDRMALMKALGKLKARRGYEIVVVSSDDSVTPWHERMSAIAKSNIVMGCHGDHLFDALFMKPSPQSTLIELFPPESFTSDRQLAFQSVGLKYISWNNNAPFTPLPNALAYPYGEDPIALDADSIVSAIQTILST